MRMAERKQNENLKKGKDTQFRNGEEAAKNGRKGGKASGVARREKKTMAETLQMFLSMPIDEGTLADIDSLRNLKELKDKNISVQEAIILKQTSLAMKGDPRAAAFVMSLIKDNEAKVEEAGVTIIDDFK